jgi:CBS domain-containing protein
MIVTGAMTRRPVSITPGWGVRQAAILASQYEVSSLPVVDPQGRICGIVSDADLIRDTFAATPANSVCDVMTSPAVTVLESTELSDVVDLMTSRSLSSLPVVDHEGQVVGMISRSDIVRLRAVADFSGDQCSR